MEGHQMPIKSATTGSKRRPIDQRIYDPAIRPDWRFERVLSIVTLERRADRCAPFDDNYVRTMRQFMLMFRPRGPIAREYLYVKFPGPFLALKIHEDEVPDTRLFLQC